MNKFKHALLILMVVFFSCKQTNNVNISPKIIVNKLPEKDLPYLKVDESQLKITSPEEDKRKAQIMLSGYKRAYKYIDLDTINFNLIYSIKSGDEINISPLINEYIESIVYFSNKNFQAILKEHPEHIEGLKDAMKKKFSKEGRANKEFVNNLPDRVWSLMIGGVKKYREENQK
ncbi:MAG: hypothetical protein ABFS35_06990 [Bacteroidota bacterium]